MCSRSQYVGIPGMLMISKSFASRKILRIVICNGNRRKIRKSRIFYKLAVSVAYAEVVKDSLTTGFKAVECGPGGLLFLRRCQPGPLFAAPQAVQEVQQPRNLPWIYLRRGLAQINIQSPVKGRVPVFAGKACRRSTAMPCLGMPAMLAKEFARRKSSHENSFFRNMSRASISCGAISQRI